MEGYCGKGRSRLLDASKDLPKVLGQYDSMKRKVKEEWGYILSRLLSLVSTMYRRLERITAVGGAATPY